MPQIMTLPEIHPLIVLGITISIIFTIGGLAVKVAQLFTKYSLVEKVDKKSDLILQRLADIGAKVDLIFGKGELSFAQSKSPISLTERGLKFYNELNLNKIIDNHWDSWLTQMIKLIEDRKEQGKGVNAYDIQKICFDLFDDFPSMIDNDELDKIKSHAFENGIDLILYDSLFQVPIRDRLLKYLGLSVDYIDKHHPNSKKKSS